MVKDRKYFQTQYGVLKHKCLVFKYLLIFSAKLIWRGIIHDLSKLKSPESIAFASAPDLSNIVYGSEEYHENCKKLKKCLDHHYANNSHHFQFYKDKFKGMNALDRVEMAADWLASSKRTKDGNVCFSIEKNQSRAGYSNQDKQWLLLIIKEMES